MLREAEIEHKYGVILTETQEVEAIYKRLFLIIFMPQLIKILYLDGQFGDQLKYQIYKLQGLIGLYIHTL